MARSNIGRTSADLIKDSGSVLFSLVMGEQLEYPVTLEFLPNINNSFIFEAVVVEALNVPYQGSPPKEHLTGGAQTTLVVRLPPVRGQWEPAGAYYTNEIVTYNGRTFRMMQGMGRVNSMPPDLDPVWEEVTGGLVYIQFPKTLGLDWQQMPTVDSHVYGFFELRVTQPAGAAFQSTWKPVRGMIELQFSPTELVPD